MRDTAPTGVRNYLVEERFCALIPTPGIDSGARRLLIVRLEVDSLLDLGLMLFLFFSGIMFVSLFEGESVFLFPLNRVHKGLKDLQNRVILFI